MLWENYDVVSRELEWRVRLFSVQDQPEYFRLLKEYDDWGIERDRVFEERGIDFKELYSDMDMELRPDDGLLDWMPVEKRDYSLLKEFVEMLPVVRYGFAFNTVLENIDFSSFLDYQNAFLRIYLGFNGGSLFEEMFFLRNLRSYLDNGGDDGWLEGEDPQGLYEVVIESLADKIFDISKRSGKLDWMYESVKVGIPQSSTLLTNRLEEGNDKVTVFAERDRYLVEVISDLEGRINRKFVTKTADPFFGEDEFGLWVDSSPSSRLYRDYQVAKGLRETFPSGFLDFPLPVYCFDGKDQRTSIIAMGRVEGRTLLEIGSLDLTHQFVRLLPFFHNFAYAKGLHGVERYKFKDEMEMILKSLRYRGDNLNRLAKPLVKLLKIWRGSYEGVIHGSLHSKNVKFNGKRFSMLDFELTCLGYCQDDVIRQIEEDRFKFSNDRRSAILQDYFAISALARGEFFENPNWVNEAREIVKDRQEIVDEREYVRFFVAYNLRRFVLHLWAARKMVSKGKEEVLTQLDHAEESLLLAETYMPRLSMRRQAVSVRRLREGLREELKSSGIGSIL
ncbi:hypothetical protein HOD38_04475 [archaeon]|jgi:hypothetical protein|nr:hypothetical protein [archaeon]MBT4397497.1 hypothetical protein [archaeon]MBT4440892.1 hypothetical protein [archaeon]